MINHYVLNLPESKDRQKLMTDEFKKIGIAHTFFLPLTAGLYQKNKKRNSV